MDVIKLRQLVFIDWCHPATRFDNKHNRIVGYMRFVLAVSIGYHDLAAVGHLDPRNSFFLWIPFAIPIRVVVNNTLSMSMGIVTFGRGARRVWFVPEGGVTEQGRTEQENDIRPKHLDTSRRETAED